VTIGVLLVTFLLSFGTVAWLAPEDGGGVRVLSRLNNEAWRRVLLLASFAIGLLVLNNVLYVWVGGQRADSFGGFDVLQIGIFAMAILLFIDLRAFRLQRQGKEPREEKPLA